MGPLRTAEHPVSLSRTTAGLPWVILTALLCYGITRLVVLWGGSFPLGLGIGLSFGIVALLVGEGVSFWWSARTGAGAKRASPHRTRPREADPQEASSAAGPVAAERPTPARVRPDHPRARPGA